MSNLNGRRKHNHALRRVSDEDLLAMRETMTLREIAEKYGCTISTVSKRLTRMGVAGTRPRYDDLIPWRVLVVHSDAYEVECLRLLGAYRAGKELSKRDQAQLVRWLEKCLSENVRVGYEAELGFFYCPANAHTREEHPYHEEGLCGSSQTVRSA